MSKFSLRKSLCKLRISANQLMIELGRCNKNKLQRDERICKKCDTGNVEDEFHFLFECSKDVIFSLKLTQKTFYLHL